MHVYYMSKSAAITVHVLVMHASYLIDYAYMSLRLSDNYLLVSDSYYYI